MYQEWKFAVPAMIQRNSNNIYVLRLSGVVKRWEFSAGQAGLAREIDAGSHPRVMAIFKNFEGWERDADWKDFDFQLSDSNEISRIAIVGDASWEAEALAFAGAGFRKSKVKFFPTGQEGRAGVWLTQ